MLQIKLFVFITALAMTHPTMVGAQWPIEFTPNDIQKGYKAGLAPELHGLWLGDEKYKEEDGSIGDYCSAAIFHQEAYLTWQSVPSTCQAAGANPKQKTVTGNFFEKIEFPAYIYRFRQKKCLSAKKCQNDITKDSDPLDQYNFDGWEVLAKACGVHLKDDQLTENTYTCEQYQVNLIRRRNKTLLVVVLSYHFFQDGWDNYECPEFPSFLQKNIAFPGDGSARFVLHREYNKTIFDPCTWDCFDDPGNTFNCT